MENHVYKAHFQGFLSLSLSLTLKLLLLSKLPKIDPADANKLSGPKQNIAGKKERAMTRTREDYPRLAGMERLKRAQHHLVPNDHLRM